ncbi:hypothetical protein DER45DRAFT_555465 [Fusarium avenaceum]|nr:hypothetical protein DER45DRAFT_555465 [Fusarium avenaceum]
MRDCIGLVYLNMIISATVHFVLPASSSYGDLLVYNGICPLFPVYIQHWLALQNQHYFVLHK